MERLQTAVRGAGERATDVKQTASALSTEAGALSGEVKDFVGALNGFNEGMELLSYDLDLPATATATVDGRVTAGKVLKASPGAVLFTGQLSLAPEAVLELRISGTDRPLRARFVEADQAGLHMQLPLNFESLTYMGQTLRGLATSRAA